MSVKELIRPDLNPDMTVRHKPEKPTQYKIVYGQGLPFVCDCHLNLLTYVFNKSEEDAIRHIFNALEKGKDIVFVAGKDEVETKMLAANDELSLHQSHNPFMRTVSFRCEPL